MNTREIPMILPSLLDTYTLALEDGYASGENEFSMWCLLAGEVERLTGQSGLAAEKIVRDTMVAMKVWKRENFKNGLAIG